MKWGQRNETLLRSRGIGPDARFLYLMLRHEIAHVCGIIDVAAETMTRHCEFNSQQRTVAALAILTKTDEEQKLGDRPAMLVWDDYLPLGYLVGWCEWSPPQNNGQLASRLSFLSTLPDCAVRDAALADLDPWLNRWPAQERRAPSDDVPPAEEPGAREEPLHPSDDHRPAPARRAVRKVPPVVDPVTPEYLSDLYRHFLPLRPQLSPYELKPESSIGGRMADLCVEQPKGKSWRAFFAHAAKLCDDKGCIAVDGKRISVDMRTLLGKQLGDYVLAAAGAKHKEGES